MSAGYQERILDAIGFLPEEGHGPLPGLLLMLTLVTGLVDAVSYLALGRVFVANMTGNVVILGFAVADAANFSVLATLSAIAAFLGGAFAGGRLGLAIGVHRGRFLAYAIYIKIVLVAAALVIAVSTPQSPTGLIAVALILLLGVAMGIQNATARRLAVPDLTTTVLTMTLTSLAADWKLPGAVTANPARRLVATLTMFIGATIGALLVLHAHVDAALALVLLLLILTGIAASRYSASTAAWTGGH